MKGLFCAMSLLRTGLPLRNFKCPGQARHPFNMEAAAPGFKAAHQVFNGPWVGVTGCTDLNGSSPGEQKLDSILRCDDAAHAKNRNFHGLRRLVDHSPSNGLDGWAGEAPGDVAQARPPRLDIDGHSEKCVCQA